MGQYAELLKKSADDESKKSDLKNKRSMYKLYDEAALIKLGVESAVNRKITRFTVAGVIILIENSLQMSIFYDD